MIGEKAIALSWLTFAATIAIWGGLMAHIAIPIIAGLIWIVGIFLIFRRKHS